MSNLFENNEPEKPSQEVQDLGDRLFGILPSPFAGQRYELKKLSDGRVAILVVTG